MNSSAGIGDPYFYEWTVGIEKVINLMIPEEKMKSVTLQSTMAMSLDDVVCEYEDYFEYIQVKHSRENKSFGFSSLLHSTDKNKSLMNKIANSWKKLREKEKLGQAILLTNRRAVENESALGKNSNKIYVPSFLEFWEWFEEKKEEVKTISDLFSNAHDEWQDVIQLMIRELDVFDGNEELIIEFIHNFSIKYRYLEIDELDENILKKLMTLFSIDDVQASNLYQKLFFALKEWASSTRIKEEITVEDVFSKLSIFEKKYMKTKLLPPEPFFESRESLVSEIEDECRNGQNNILFLYGKPGIGKTSLINLLDQKLDSLIDLRYFAYVPITPYSNSVSLDYDNSILPEELWGSLLEQLRALFTGKLYKYQVPINNSFLTVSEMRENVLRLASEYSKIHDKKTVIVIDGIDHAARAGKGTNFLQSLLSPENVPEGVVFIICGQPSEDYSEYPLWLTPENPLISTVEIQGITENDIQNLLIDINPEFENIDLFAKEILKYSKGNTLSAIFSAYESKKVKNVAEFIHLLKSKFLTSNITEYYNHIWTSRSLHYTKGKEIGNSLLAGIFVLSKEKVHINDFCKIFDDVPLTKIQWKSILASYSPLIIEKDDYYYLYHNDIKVFLENKLQNQGIIKEVASRIANFYITDQSKVYMRHNDLFRLLELANRNQEKLEIFTLDYLKEAFYINQNIDEIVKQFKEICLIFESSFDYKYLEKITLIAIVLNQYVKVLERYDITQEESQMEYFISEFKKINLNQVQFDELENTLNEIKELFEFGEKERAIRTFKKWFTKFELIFRASLENTFKRDDGRISSNRVSNFVRELTYLAEVFPVEMDCEFISKNSQLEQAVFIGTIEGIIENDDIEKYKISLINYKNQILDNLNKLLELLFDTNKIKWIELLINQTWDESKFDIVTTINLDFFKLLLNKHIDSTKFLEWIYSDSACDFFKNRVDDPVILFSRLAFIFGKSILRDDMKKLIDRLKYLFFLSKNDKRSAGSLDEILRIYFEIGSLNMEAAKVDIQELTTIFEKNWNIKNSILLPHDAFTASRFIEWYIVFYVEKTCDNNLETQLTQYFITLTKNKKKYSDKFTRLIWLYLYRRGFDEALKNYFLTWLGEHGLAWDETIDDMRDTYELFMELIKLLDEPAELIDRAKLKFRIHLLEFVGHKEDVIYYPLQTFQVISSMNSNEWYKRGLDLLNLSERVNKKGDNLISGLVKESVVEASMESGANHFLTLISSKNFEELVISKIKKISFSMEPYLESDTERLSYWFLLEAISEKADESDRIFNYLSLLSQNFDETKNIIIESRLYELEETIKGYETPKSTSKKKKEDELILMSMQEIMNELLEADFGDFESRSDLLNLYNKVVDRLNTNRDEYFRIHRDTIFSIFLKIDEGYSWQSQGMEQLVASLFPLITDLQREALFTHIIHNKYFERSEISYWLSSFTDDLNQYTIEYLKTKNFQLLLNFFDQQIKEIRVWDLSYQDTYSIQINYTEIKKNWVDVIEKILWISFSTNDIMKTRETFKGLYFFYLMFPERWDNEILISKTMVRQKYLLLLILEELVINGVNIDFAKEFICFCSDELNLLSLKVEANIVLSYMEQDTTFLRETFGGEYVDHSGIKKFVSSGHMRYYSEILGISFKKNFDDLKDIYELEYRNNFEEIKLEYGAFYKFIDDDKEEFLIQRYLYDELKGRGKSIFEISKILPIDEPFLFIEGSKSMLYDERIFSINLEENSDIDYMNQTILKEVGFDKMIIGLTWTKFFENEEMVASLAYSISPNYLDHNFENLSLGKISGRGSLIQYYGLYEREYNPDESLFDNVYGSTIYLSSLRMIPSSFFHKILQKVDFDLTRNVFTMPNEHAYINSERYKDVTMEVWTVNKKEFEAFLFENGVKLHLIVESNLK
ncbi:ATP-binding protein [Enterococcus hirae]|uniref:ATP-binding protein n=1 Tax=Enterococcus hirae TaxID=1354 RepID=UPI00398E5B02